MHTTPSSILRQRLRAGETLIGTIIPIDAPMLIEICGVAGFDFVFLDTEHGTLLHPQYEGLLRAADLVNLPAVIRVGRDQPLEIGRALDAGAQGIHIPFVETAAQAEAVVRAARFYPEGQRGLGPVRANRYGTQPYATYVQQANADTLVVVAIESFAAINALHSIAEVPGIDVIFVAPADLSVMAGQPGQIEHPEVQRIIAQAITTAKGTGTIVGSLAISPQQLAEQGVQYILMVLTSVIVQGAQAWLATARTTSMPP